MPLTVTSKFMTSGKRAIEADLVTALDRLKAPLDESCEIEISERHVDRALVVVIRRRRQTRLWSDGWTMTRESPEYYRYERKFEESPAPEQVAESVQRMLNAPGWEASATSSSDGG